jgi:NMD protein affecting ribosome stability and mRNA decay
MMETICCKCQKHMGWKEGPEGTVSHGICSECLISEYQNIFTPEELNKILLKSKNR